MSSIFVSIANYKDTETMHTVNQVMNNHSRQHDITCVVLSQIDADDTRFLDLDHEPGVIHHIIHSDLSQGVCWARAQIQKSYTHQDYYLQLDSHIMLDKDWDLTLMAELARAPAEKPIISCYPMPYIFDQQRNRHVPERSTCDFQIYLEDNVPKGGSGPVPDSTCPVPCLYLAAGFLFTTGSWVTDVPYDQELFFNGEEISLSIRSYCQGYRMFIPSTHVAAHLYNDTTGAHRALFWDHCQDQRRRISWHRRDETSLLKVKLLCQGRWHGTYGITDLESFWEYHAAVLHKHQVDITKVSL